MAYKILVVDDELTLLNTVRAYLEQEGFSVQIASDGRSALQLFRNFQPDLVVLDIMLPEIDGLEVLRQLRQSSDVYVIMLTAKVDEADKVIGLGLGADDYVTKPFDLRELLARIKSVLRRSESIPKAVKEPEQLRFADFCLQLREHRLTDLAGQEIVLTHGEFKLLAALARCARTPLTRDQILELTHGREAGPYDRTVDMQITRLRRKLGDDPKRPNLIRSVRGVGYMLACAVESGEPS